MVIHDFIYQWDGKSHDGEKPIAWWPGSYHVKIVKLASDKPDVTYLVPTAVILKNAKMNTGVNTSLRNYIHTFAMIISEKYNIDMKQTLWVEVDDTIRATRLEPDPTSLALTSFTIDWRPIRPNEEALLEPYLADM